MAGKEIEGGHEDEMYLTLGGAPSARSVASARSWETVAQLHSWFPTIQTVQ